MAAMTNSPRFLPSTLLQEQPDSELVPERDAARDVDPGFKINPEDHRRQPHPQRQRPRPDHDLSASAAVLPDLRGQSAVSRHCRTRAERRLPVRLTSGQWLRSVTN